MFWRGATENGKGVRQARVSAFVLLVLENPRSRLSSRLDGSRPIQATSRESQVYQFHGDRHAATDGDRGLLAKRRIRSLPAKASARLDDSGPADEQCRRSLFPRWN